MREETEVIAHVEPDLLAARDEAHEIEPEERSGPRLVVTVSPDAAEPFGEVILTASIEADELPEDTKGEVVFLDDQGNERGRAALTDRLDPQPFTARLECMAPERPGKHVWTARLESEDLECDEVSFTVTIAPHPISVTIWDMPPAIEQGRSFPMKVGLRCPCGCNAQGWTFRLLDSDGSEILAGQVGDEPWPGTASLYYACLDVAAPDTAGSHRWTVVAEPPEGSDVPHAERRLSIVLNVMRQPEVSLRIRARDAKTGEPVAGAKVVAHPYRTRTGEDGEALLHLPKGTYTVFVSRSPYFAFKSQGEISEDMTLTAELHEDRALTDAELWA